MDKMITVRVTEKEREKVKADARVAKLSTNMYIRMKLRLGTLDRRFKESK